MLKADTYYYAFWTSFNFEFEHQGLKTYYFIYIKHFYVASFWKGSNII